METHSIILERANLDQAVFQFNFILNRYPKRKKRIAREAKIVADQRAVVRKLELV